MNLFVRRFASVPQWLSEPREPGQTGWWLCLDESKHKPLFKKTMDPVLGGTMSNCIIAIAALHVLLPTTAVTSITSSIRLP